MRADLPAAEPLAQLRAGRAVKGADLSEIPPPAAGQRLSLAGCRIAGGDWRGQAVAGKVLIKDCAFAGPLDLSGCDLAAEVRLEGCAFAGGLILAGATFRGAVTLKGCTGAVSFAGARFLADACLERLASSEPLALQEATFEAGLTLCLEGASLVGLPRAARWGKLTLRGCLAERIELEDQRFEGPVTLKDVAVDGPLELRRCQLAAAAKLVDLHVRTLDLSRSRFEALILQGVALGGDADLRGIVAASAAIQVAAVREQGLDLAGASIGTLKLQGEGLVLDRAPPARAGLLLRRCRVGLLTDEGGDYTGEIRLDSCTIAHPLRLRGCRLGGGLRLEQCGLLAGGSLDGSEISDLRVRGCQSAGVLELGAAVTGRCIIQLSGSGSVVFAAADLPPDAAVELTGLAADTLPLGAASVSAEGCQVGALQAAERAIPGKLLLKGCAFASKVALAGCAFGGEVRLTGCALPEGADLSGASFAADASFHSTTFGRFANLGGAVFRGRCVLTRARFERGLKLSEAEFHGDFSFNDAACQHRLQALGAVFRGEARFTGALLAQVCELDGAIFHGGAHLSRVHFGAEVRFRGASFRGPLELDRALADGDVSFDEARLEGEISLRRLLCFRNLDFQSAVLGPDATWRLVDAHLARLLLEREQVEGRLASARAGEWGLARREYGLLKKAWRENSRYEQEDWAYRMEKRMERAALPLRRPLGATQRFLSWLILDLSSGYGTQPLNIAAAAAASLLAFAALFASFPGQFAGGEVGPAAAVMLSFRTFTNAEVPSVEPLPGSWMSYAVMAESALGFFAMMLLVVTFSRKVIR